MLDYRAFGVNVIESSKVTLLAKVAGYDSIFINPEHTVLSVQHASALCSSADAIVNTRFVGVPYQCGHLFVQMVLGEGTTEIIIPCINAVGTF